MKKYIGFLIVLGIFVFGASRAQAEYDLANPCSSNMPPSVTVLSPNGGETYLLGQQVEVKWKHCNVLSSNNIHINIKNQTTGAAYYLVAYGPNGSGTLNDGVEVVTIPNTIPLGKYKIGVSSFVSGGTSPEDWSDNSFIINALSVAPSITVLSPNGGEVFIQGQLNNISWSGGQSKVQVGLINHDYLPGGSNLSVFGWIELNGQINGKITWDGRTLKALDGSIQPQIKLGKYKIVTVTKSDIGNYCIGTGINSDCSYDVSDNSFTINSLSTSSSITVLSPNGNDVYTAGQKIEVKWNTQNISGDIAEINLNSINGWGGGEGYTFDKQLKNDGKEVLTLPTVSEFVQSNSSFGKYFTIEIVAVDNVGIVRKDSSDSLFTINLPTSTDTTPRIMYFSGKVNQHTDVKGNWLTDPDGTSGANLDKLTYCKKWFPNTIKVEDYKLETISGWRNRGNVDGPFTSTKMSTKCVQTSIGETPQITVLSPNGGEAYTVGQPIKVRWTSAGIPADKLLAINIFGNNNGMAFGFLTPNGTANDGIETITLGSEYPTTGGYKIVVGVPYGNEFNNSALSPKDQSDNFFTLNSSTPATSPITVLSPNGGETYKIGDNQLIKWTDKIVTNQMLPTPYDIKLLPVMAIPTCIINAPCPVYDELPPYVIAQKIIGYSYDWRVGTYLNIPDGNYRMEICRFGTDVCDISDSYFKIVSDDLTDDQPNGCLEGQKYNPKTGEICNQVYKPLKYGTPYVPIKRTLRVGVKGEDVKTIQSFLNLSADGSFGPKTMNAVKMFQQKNNLVPDGVVGPKTILLFK